MLVLREGQVCPYGTRCPYTSDTIPGAKCQGLNPQRGCEFRCSFVKEDGRIADGYQRNSKDKTGHMRVLID